MYTLFGSPGSGSAMIEMALERIGQPWQLRRASSWEPDSEQAELRRHNPLLQIPTLLLPDGGVLSESAAILIHLGLVHPEAGLLPSEPAARAQALRGLVFIAANCYASIGVIDFPERVCAEADADTRERIQRGARAQLHRQWEIFADQFPAAPFLNGERTGALDFMAVVVSRWSGARAHLAKQRPDFHALLRRIEAEPDLAPLLARHWPA
ncbi:glutathione S-transferase family protein [Paucibacter sp. M5-1]|uniref:glutathione S-transferase family protein n=1 Tax=Paucibacter sp. M5-1 TaxID=3015998 RepID=UPI0022B88BEC|nr:glutathione S-transferase [Paucibacter sp. M5-1]MCZ7882826.1 glutathione S-transferase [Paucibacter sp. M5-1]